MFKKSAQFYDALYRFKNYAAASEQLHTLLRHYHPAAQSLLDVGCGTGTHLMHLRSWYQVEGLDVSPEMLAVAQGRCGDSPLHQSSMVDFRLNRHFDVITCLFSSIGYVKTVESLRSTLSSMARHLRPGGVVVVEPWFSPENFWVGKVTANFVDEPDLKIAWMYVSEREGRLSILNTHYLVARAEGVEHFTERHELGLFTHEEYREAFVQAGLEVHYDPTGLFGRGMYLGVAAAGD